MNYFSMIFSVVLAIGMIVGVLFIREVQKMLGASGQHASMVLVALMFLWDGIIIYMMKGYMAKEELAIGILLGTLLKTFTLIKTFKL